MSAKRKRGKYTPEHLKMARQLGKEGFAVSEASVKMGIDRATFLHWEREKPAFKRAAAKIRENSEKWKALRFEKLLGRSEERLLAALAIIRQKRSAEMEKYNVKFGSNNNEQTKMIALRDTGESGEITGKV